MRRVREVCLGPDPNMNRLDGLMWVLARLKEEDWPNSTEDPELAWKAFYAADALLAALDNLTGMDRD